MSKPKINEPTTDEQDVIDAAHARRARCACGEVHDDSAIAPDVIARMQAYMAANPGHRFAVDEESGIVGVVILRDPEPPEILARSEDLLELLDTIDAPSAADLS